MLEHGQAVHDAYKILLDAGLDEIDKNLWQWLISNQYDQAIMENYHIYHDCGKPACRIVDAQERQHFPEHAKHSYYLHKEIFDCPAASEMIRQDMHFHELKSDALVAWLKLLDDKTMASLFLTALAEVKANSMMFGGEDSTSYKIKKKHLLKAAKKIQSQILIDG